MRKDFSSGSLLILSLLLTFAHGSGARELNEKHSNVLRLRRMDAGDNKNDDARYENDFPQHVHANDPSFSHMHDIDPVLSIFFTLKDLKVGKTMPIYFPKLEPTALLFLPRETAESISFSSKQLPYLLQFFSYSDGSPQARKLEETLMTCETKPGIEVEKRFCATSLESLLDFVRAILEVPHFRVLTTDHLTGSKTSFQNYTIREMPEEINVPRVIVCHPIPYPYAVFFCHSIPETRIFRVSLEGENGDRIEALATCHMNTTGWNPDHVAFRLFGTTPGSTEVCHVFPANNLIWVPRVQV